MGQIAYEGGAPVGLPPEETTTAPPQAARLVPEGLTETQREMYEATGQPTIIYPGDKNILQGFALPVAVGAVIFAVLQEL